jgi:hypothetical protein
MDSTLLAGLIGAGATVIAAAIGAFALVRTQKANKTGQTKASEEPALPYSLHRDELERKEREVRELLKTVMLYRSQAQLTSEQRADVQRYFNNLTDFFEDVTEERKLELEVAVKDDGRTAIFCNKDLKVDLKCVEVFVGEKGMIFVDASGSRRPIGLPLTDAVVAPLATHKPTKVLLVRVDSTGTATSGICYPMRVYDPHPAGLPEPLAGSSAASDA